MSISPAKIIMPALAVLCLTPWISSGVALLLGITLALTLGNPYLALTKEYASRLLAIAIVGLGAGMNLESIAAAGLNGIFYTLTGIGAALGIGALLGRFFKTDKNTSVLISVGTAICGGSAIAAIAPVIRAKDHEISVALGVVFLLNAVALFVFPAIGHALDLSQYQFGLWSALAIHDTSSVVGASMHYGPEALETGTTVKLARALWIVPLALAFQFMVMRRDKAEGVSGKIKYPWFILGFIGMAALVTWIPVLQPAGHILATAGRHLLVLTLFLIGANLTKERLKTVGFKPLLHGVCLWLIIAAGSLLLISGDVVKVPENAQKPHAASY